MNDQSPPDLTPSKPPVEFAGQGWHFDAPAEFNVRGAVVVARQRMIFMLAAFAFCFFLVFVKLVDATVLSGVDEPRQAEAAGSGMMAAGSRADIIDRNGQVLATSLPTVSMFADAVRVIEPERTTEKLREVFPDLETARLLADLKSNKRFVWIKRHLTPQQYAAANKLGLPGVDFQREFRRVYPHGPLFAHALGYIGVDQEGLAGLEKTMDQRLRMDPEPLRLSLDVRLQYILKRELQAGIDSFTAVGGAGMIMDVQTGEIVAMVSLPDFDPHEPGLASDDAKFNRDTLGVYEMGSTFKIFNTAMALDSGKVKLEDRFDTTHNIRIGRFTITDFHPAKHNYNVPEIMMESSNLGSVHMYEQVGVEGQKQFLSSLGLTKQAKLEIPERGEPMVPNPWRDVNGMTISFGHGLAVSPLHLVRGVAAIVNGGLLIDPTLIKRKPEDLVLGERVISEKTSLTMRQLMRLVVTNGTAKGAEAAGYLVGGKTGTADKLQGKGYAKNARLSSFAGAFPMNNPRYVVFVMIDEPKPNAKSYGYATGGWVAAPVVGKIVSQMAPLLGIAPQAVSDKPDDKAKKPDADDEEPQLEVWPNEADNVTNLYQPTAAKEADTYEATPPFASAATRH